MSAGREAVRKIIDDPFEFVSRLQILTKANRKRFFHPMWQETEHFFRHGLVGGRKYVMALKPRQVAYTTATCAYEFWKAYTSPHAHRCVQVVHHVSAFARIREMVEVFHSGLPAEFQRGFSRHNDAVTRFAHNDSGFNRILAGGRGQGRSWSFNDAHLSEMAFYPAATPASARDGAGASDETTWQSILATLAEGTGDERVVVESTGNGPRGLFYSLFKEAQQNPEWTYIFLPWTAVERYRREVPDPDEFHATLNQDELELQRVHGLTLEQLAWRRHKLTTEKYSLARFRREYPLVDIEPFLLASSGWYDQETLVRLLGYARHDLARETTQELRLFHPVGCGCGCNTRHTDRFFIALDPSHGVGRDYSVAHVLRGDLLHVATWQSNTTRPLGQARAVARLGAMFGGDWGSPPLCLVEGNNRGGKSVLERLRSMGVGSGVTMWTDPNTGRDFYSTGAGAGDRKREVMEYSREVIEDEATIIEDAMVLLQAQNIVEKWNGKVEARDDDAITIGGKDDSIVAYALALYCARSHYQRRLVDNDRSIETEQARRARLARQRFEERV